MSKGEHFLFSCYSKSEERKQALNEYGLTDVCEYFQIDRQELHTDNVNITIRPLECSLA